MNRHRFSAMQVRPSTRSAPWILFLCLCIGVAAFWFAIERHEQVLIGSNTRTVALQSAAGIDRYLEGQRRSFRSMTSEAALWLHGRPPHERLPRYRELSRNLLSEYRDIVSVFWLDPSGGLLQLSHQPRLQGRLAPAVIRQTPEYRTLVRRAQELRSSVTSPPLGGGVDAGSYLIAVPYSQGESLLGIAVIRSLCAEVPLVAMPANLGDSYRLRVEYAGATVLDALQGSAEGAASEVLLQTPGWKVVVEPTAALVMAFSSPAQEWMSLFGLAFSAGAALLLACLLRRAGARDADRAELEFLGLHNRLSRRLNREGLRRAADLHLQKSGAQSQLAVLFLDLNQFRYVNDAFGHRAGDRMLVQFADLLEENLPKGAILGHLGSDHFVVLAPGAGTARAGWLASRLLTVVDESRFQLEGRVLHLTISLGVAIAPEHGVKAEGLFARADTALHRAKQQGRGTWSIYQNGDQDTCVRDKLVWEDRIRRALEQDRFRVLYQPMLDLKTNRLTSVEALVRMVGKGGELIAPGAFIGVAERFGLIRQIDRLVIQKVMSQLVEWERTGLRIDASVNISGAHFGHSALLQQIANWLETTGVDPGRILFEITETEAVGDIDRAQSFVQALRRLGCRFALDDFGVGFSTFEYLRRMQVDAVKIDGSFVRNLHKSPPDRVFVKAAVQVAQGFGSRTVGEFVENAAILANLDALGVDAAQGYFIAPPMPAEDIPSFVRSWGQAETQHGMSA